MAVLAGEIVSCRGEVGHWMSFQGVWKLRPKASSSKN